ncbi:hypothetical protein [Nocardia sp. NBC_01009]|uniref:hypothetical protein n=1 Tax=Nocardia sp. NBC_01009 TaxID=2975996 RepID=UPI0038632AB5|nr:hypothetical protein OHA42_17440 [Nocardia sp. NBC_01009]
MAVPWDKRWRAEVDSYREQFERGFLTFAQPFDDRSVQADQFDELFDGTEAILAEDRDNYAAALAETGGDTAGPAFGRPLPDPDATLGRIAEPSSKTSMSASSTEDTIRRSSGLRSCPPALSWD